MRLVIVDEEPTARAALVHLCERNSDVQIVGEADTGAQAIDAIERFQPDVLLLDVELPDMTGFDVLRAARRSRDPLTIMVTADAKHAVRAFAAGALDYLLKPVSAPRFTAALERVRERRGSSGQWSEQAPALASEALPHARPVVPVASARVLIGERERRLYPLDPEKVEYIESDGNYVTIRTSGAAYISRDSIKRLATSLAACGFIRIERSLLLNVRAVAYAEPLGRGAFAFTLSSGSCIRSSATYRDAILQVLPLARPPSLRRSH
ncbi:MAG TPA: LytTR family DNA-binding domain-containing protein [Steroidobacteraceae bacterium]|nr:LytTR family DNA-binding domain-containing protein [Steroidobacteraceae bacterium]